MNAILPGAEHLHKYTRAAEHHTAIGPGCAVLSSSANCASLWNLCSVAFIPTEVPLVRWWQAGVCTYSVSFQTSRKPKELTFYWQLSSLMPSHNVIRLYVVSLGRFLRPRENSARDPFAKKWVCSVSLFATLEYKDENVNVRRESVREKMKIKCPQACQVLTLLLE